MIYALSHKHIIPSDAISIDVTSRSNTWGKYLSPFNLGPVNLYNDYWSYNVENAFQYSKIYSQFNGPDDKPLPGYLEWAQKGWHNPNPVKYPLGPWNKGLYHWWDGEKLNKLEAQNNIFIPLYKQCAIKSSAFNRLKALYESTTKDIYLIDYEGYNHRLLGLDWDKVINNPDRPIGQAFVLAMMLENYI